MSDDLCEGFIPQVWKKDRCKKCFRLKNQHGTEFKTSSRDKLNSPLANLSGSVSPRTSGSVLSRFERNTTETSGWRSKVYGETPKPTDKADKTADKNIPIRTEILPTDKPVEKSTENIPIRTEILTPIGTSDPNLPRKKLVVMTAEVSVDDKPVEQTVVHTEIQHESTVENWSAGRKNRPDSPEPESFASAKSGQSNSLSKAQSFESLTSGNFDSKSMVTAMSGDNSSTRSSTPTENLDEPNAFIRSIKAQLEIMEGKCGQLEKENATLKSGSHLSVANFASGQTTADERIKEMEEKLLNAEQMCQDYRDENTVLKCELRELQESTSHYPNSADMKDLRDKLQAAESLCEELMEENESLKRDTQDLQTEIEELQDQYREEEIEEFREIQRELEQTAKNCRILQFKLRKAERRNDQTEADRKHLQEKIKEFVAQSGCPETALDSPRVKELESELRIAKEVSVRLHNELESLDDKRCKLEDESFYMREKIRELETREKLMDISRLRSDQKKTLTGSRSAFTAGRLDSDNSTGQKSSGPHGGDYNIPQLLRDLQDALERETDLRDQLKFAEEDIGAARKKLSDLETENEGLMRQLAKFTVPKRQSGRPPMSRSYSEGHAQIELELAEHEANILKNKFVKIESENAKLMAQVSLLEKEVVRAGGQTKFSDKQLSDAIPDTYYKQKIKLLEEEIDELKLRLETCQKTEVDQDMIAGKTGIARPPRPVRVGKTTRAVEADQSDTQQQQQVSVDLRRQIGLVEQEAAVLRQRIADLENENERLTEENKRIQIRKSRSANGSVAEDKSDVKAGQMEKDIHRFINRIAEIEKEKEVLNRELDRRKKLDSLQQSEKTKSTTEALAKFNVKLATTQDLREKATELLKANAELMASLKTEQQKCQEFETQLAEYKAVINQSENQRLVTMATKVEVLNNQLKSAQERLDAVHKKMTNGNSQKSAQDSSYQDLLKERLDKLELELATEKAKPKSKSPTKETKPFVTNGKTGAEANISDSLSTLELQLETLYKQVEIVETCAQKSVAVTPSVRKSTKEVEDSEQISNEMSKLKLELSTVRKSLEAQREQLLNTPTLSNANSVSSKVVDESDKLKVTIKERDQTINELKEQLDLVKQDKLHAQQECSTATERLLQTEERWNKELEKLKESYENQVKDLKYHLTEAERSREEKSSLLKERSSLLTDKSKRVTELENRVTKLESDLKLKHKDLESRLDSERKKAQEYQTKYAKLEELYEGDRVKLSAEKEKFKADLSDLKKKNDEIQTNFEQLRTASDRAKITAAREKGEFEEKIRKLQGEISEAEKTASKRAVEMASIENKKLLNEINSVKRKLEADTEAWRIEKENLAEKLDLKAKELDLRTEEIERLKKESGMLRSRIDDQKEQLEETRRARDDCRDELSRWQQTWARERSELSHKIRQEEKIQQAEHQALQLKYESRIKVMEDTSKRMQTQLTQSRRERDQNRDLLAVAEKKLAENRQKFEIEEKELRAKIQKLQKETEELEDVKVQLEQHKVDIKTMKESHESDKNIWEIEKQQLENKLPKEPEAKSSSSTSFSVSAKPRTVSSEKLLNDSMKVTTDLRNQLDTLKISYEKEVQNQRKQLEKNRQDATKERSEAQRKIRELQENVKILEIDRRNLLSTKDGGEQERTQLSSERDALMQRIHDSEIHQLANKYKLDKVADQLTDLQTKVRYGDMVQQEKREMQDTVRKALEQLMAVREDMAKTRELGKALQNGDEERWKNASRKASEDLDKDTEESTSLSSEKRLAPIGQEKESDQSSKPKSNGNGKDPKDPVPPERTTRTFGESRRSLSTESTSAQIGYEARIAELRLRSPSPSPRKITNYPEPPPSFILNTKTVVEYDSEGKRHWARRSQIKRSASYDPTPSALSQFVPITTEIESVVATKSHNRSISSGGESALRTNLHPSNASDTDSRISDISTSISPSPMPVGKKVAEIFGTLRRHGVDVSAKRSLFGGKKSRSIETSDVGHTIGAMGVHVLPPAVQPHNLPDAMQTSNTSLDDPNKLRKSSSATKFFARLTGGKKASLSHQGSREESDDESHSGPTLHRTFGRAADRTTSEEQLSSLLCYQRQTKDTDD